MSETASIDPFTEVGTGGLREFKLAPFHRSIGFSCGGIVLHRDESWRLEQVAPGVQRVPFDRDNSEARHELGEER